MDADDELKPSRARAAAAGRLAALEREMNDLREYVHVLANEVNALSLKLHRLLMREEKP